MSSAARTGDRLPTGANRADPGPARGRRDPPAAGNGATRRPPGAPLGSGRVGGHRRGSPGATDHQGAVSTARAGPQGQALRCPRTIPSDRGADQRGTRSAGARSARWASAQRLLGHANACREARTWNEPAGASPRPDRRHWRPTPTAAPYTTSSPPPSTPAPPRPWTTCSTSLTGCAWSSTCRSCDDTPVISEMSRSMAAMPLVGLRCVNGREGDETGGSELALSEGQLVGVDDATSPLCGWCTGLVPWA